MAGKRISDARAHHGPEEDRARKPQADRARKGARFRETNEKTEGLSAKDAARMRAWENS